MKTNNITTHLIDNYTDNTHDIYIRVLADYHKADDIPYQIDKKLKTT